MATTTVSYGSISIVDVTDVGELSVYPKSNLPQSIIYSPDQNSFTPNWGSSTLILTPSIWYAGEQLLTTNNYVNVSWSRREGIGSVTTLTTGETVSDGTLVVNSTTVPKGSLVVNANKFTSNSTMLTYIVTVTYQDPTLNQTLTAEGEITFTMTQLASGVKSATITGESIFKYNGDGTINGSSTITLTARVTGSGVGISAWQYQQGNGTWATYPNSGTSTTLTVNESHSVFSNDKCTIKLVTTDNSIYDLHTITKLRDGAAGTDTISAVLTNEDQMIPYTGNTGDFSSAVSRIIIYESGVDVTNQWTITQPNNMASNVTFTASATNVTNDTVTITGLTGSSGYVTFKAEKTGKTPLLKQFSVVKVSSGADGVSPTIYSLEPNAFAMNKTIGTTPTFTPASVRFNLYQTQGQTKSLYHGRIKIYENVLAKDITPTTEAKYTSSTDETNGYYDYVPSSGCTSIVCVLYESGGTTVKLDAQTIAITTDGQTGGKGDKGDNGVSALNLIVGNSYDGIPVNSNGITTSAYTVLIPFAGYQGTNKVATTVVKNGSNQYPTLFGIAPTVSDATTQADGSIQYIIPSGTTVSTDGGTVTFTFKFTEANQTVTYDYSWGKARQGSDGQNGINAVFLQLSTPNGNIIENGSGTVTIEAKLIDGATDVTSSATYIWKKYENGSYVTLSNQTASSLQVTGSMVDSYASFQCIAHYNNIDYIQYMSVLDKQDPIQVTLLSSVGDKLVNGNGVGALYVLVYKNGQEIDPIKSERFVETLPASGNKNGDYCYLLDSTNKTVTLYKYTTSWAVSSDTYTGKYEWFYRDKNGNITTTGTPSAGDTGVNDRGSKVIYIDGDLVDKKLTIDVKVTI